MLTRQYLYFPAGNALLLERRISIYQGLNLRFKSFHTFLNCCMTRITINRVGCIVLISTYSTSLFSDGKFCDLELLLDISYSHYNVSEYIVIVAFSMLISVICAKSIETSHAYKKSFLLSLICKRKITASWKHLTHWSLKIFFPWRDFTN